MADSKVTQNAHPLVFKSSTNLKHHQNNNPVHDIMILGSHVLSSGDIVERANIWLTNTSLDNNGTALITRALKSANVLFFILQTGMVGR